MIGEVWRTECMVADVMVDEMIQADEAFAGNRLLSTFSSEARGLIEPFGAGSRTDLHGLAQTDFKRRRPRGGGDHDAAWTPL